MRQMMRIFLENAVKYTPEGGHITVASRRLPEIRSTSMRHTATRATASSENVTGAPGAMWAMTCVSPRSFSAASVTGRMRPQAMTLS